MEPADWNEKTVDLEVFKSTCQACGHHFEPFNFSDFEYGRRILRTKSGRHFGLLECFENKSMEEFSVLLEKISGIERRKRQAAYLFNKTFGIACDPVEGEEIDPLKGFVCPQCGSDSLLTYDLVPRKFISCSIPLIRHSLWEKRSPDEKETLLRAALRILEASK